jgi:hypothetical protein
MSVGVHRAPRAERHVPSGVCRAARAEWRAPSDVPSAARAERHAELLEMSAAMYAMVNQFDHLIRMRTHGLQKPDSKLPCAKPTSNHDAFRCTSVSCDTLSSGFAKSHSGWAPRRKYDSGVHMGVLHAIAHLTPLKFCVTCSLLPSFPNHIWLTSTVRHCQIDPPILNQVKFTCAIREYGMTSHGFSTCIIA